MCDLAREGFLEGGGTREIEVSPFLPHTKLMRPLSEILALRERADIQTKGNGVR